MCSKFLPVLIGCISQLGLATCAPAVFASPVVSPGVVLLPTTMFVRD